MADTPIGSCWAPDTWAFAAWADGTWCDVVPAQVPSIGGSVPYRVHLARPRAITGEATIAIAAPVLDAVGSLGIRGVVRVAVRATTAGEGRVAISGSVQVAVRATIAGEAQVAISGPDQAEIRSDHEPHEPPVPVVVPVPVPIRPQVVALRSEPVQEPPIPVRVPLRPARVQPYALAPAQAPRRRPEAIDREWVALQQKHDEEDALVLLGVLE